MVKKGTIMIKLNGIYKLKKIKGFSNDDDSDYQVIAIENVSGKDTAYCKNLKTGEGFCFFTQFLIDPEKPEESEFELIKIEK